MIGLSQRFKPIRGKTLLERFEEKFVPEPNTGCWLWLAALTKGYGVMYVGLGDHSKRRSKEAHIVAYELFVGPVPEGLELDHKCKNKCCVNPAHVEPVTHQENMRRADAGKKTGARRRAMTHCRKGHAYDKRNTYYDVTGARVCRACKRDWLHAKLSQGGSL